MQKHEKMAWMLRAHLDNAKLHLFLTIKCYYFTWEEILFY